MNICKASSGIAAGCSKPLIDKQDALPGRCSISRGKETVRASGKADRKHRIDTSVRLVRATLCNPHFPFSSGSISAVPFRSGVLHRILLCPSSSRGCRSWQSSVRRRSVLSYLPTGWRCLRSKWLCCNVAARQIRSV